MFNALSRGATLFKGVWVALAILMVAVGASGCKGSSTVSALEANKRDNALALVHQFTPALETVISESSLELVNSVSFSLGFEGFNIEDQDMDLLDERTVQFYNRLLQDQAVIDAQLRLYEHTFTNEELAQISAFYATSAGKKWLAESSRIHRGVRTAVQSRMYELMPDYMTALKPLLRTSENSILEPTQARAQRDTTTKSN